MTTAKKPKPIPAFIGPDRMNGKGGFQWATMETKEVDSGFGFPGTIEFWTLWHTNSTAAPLDEASHHARVKGRGVSRSEALEWCDVGDAAARTLAAIVDARGVLLLAWRAIQQGKSYPLRGFDGESMATTEIQNMMTSRAMWLEAARLRLEHPGEE